MSLFNWFKNKAKEINSPQKEEIKKAKELYLKKQALDRRERVEKERFTTFNDLKLYPTCNHKILYEENVDYFQKLGFCVWRNYRDRAWFVSLD